MNAFELFFQTAKEDFLPASVPISDSHCNGMATVVFDVHGSGAEEMAFSKNSDSRARVAIYACNAAQNKAVQAIVSSAGRA